MSQPRTSVFAARSLSEAPKPKQPSSVPLRIFAVCLTSVVVAVHYTNFGPLIPVMRDSLHITNGLAGLLSTFLFLVGQLPSPAALGNSPVVANRTNALWENVTCRGS